LSNPLWQVLADVDAAGHEVNDCIRIDRQGESTKVAITWVGVAGMSLYRQGFDTILDDTLAAEIRDELEAHR
jgi:hypothetical protein